MMSANRSNALASASRALGRAAFDGEASFKRLAKTILEELAKVALDRIFTSGSKGGGLPFFGAKAAGGAVNAGGAYLVGERGPELFVPNQSGNIAPQAAGAVSIHFHLGDSADATAIARHQGQIAAAVARAVAYGRRNL
jgi:phage-related minor tail protein